MVKYLGAAIAVALDESGRMPIVRDCRFGNPLWKFPGGGIKEEDYRSAASTDIVVVSGIAAARELEEETGAVALRKHLLYVVVKPDGHRKYVWATLADCRCLKVRGDEQEEVRIVTMSEILSMRENVFMAEHKLFLYGLCRYVGLIM